MSNVDPRASDTSSIGNVAPAQDQEVVFYEGSPKLRGETGLIFKCLITALIIALIPFPLEFVWKSYPGWLIVITTLLALLIVVLPALLIRKNRYRISNYRIDYEQGLLSKRIDTLELWHVEDVQMEQSLMDRILGVGTINVNSTDRTTPVLALRSLPDPRKLYDAIKQRVIAVKRQRGVFKSRQPDAGYGSRHARSAPSRMRRDVPRATIPSSVEFSQRYLHWTECGFAGPNVAGVESSFSNESGRFSRRLSA